MFFFKPPSVDLMCATCHRNFNKHIKLCCFSSNPQVLICCVLLVIEISTNTLNLLCATCHRNFNKHIELCCLSVSAELCVTLRLTNISLNCQTLKLRSLESSIKLGFLDFEKYVDLYHPLNYFIQK